MLRSCEGISNVLVHKACDVISGVSHRDIRYSLYIADSIYRSHESLILADNNLLYLKIISVSDGEPVYPPSIVQNDHSSILSKTSKEAFMTHRII